MGHVVCRTPDCGDAGIVKDNRVPLLPGERVICGPCGAPMDDTDDPLTPTVITLPDGTRVRQTGYLVELLDEEPTP